MAEKEPFQIVREIADKTAWIETERGGIGFLRSYDKNGWLHHVTVNVFISETHPPWTYTLTCDGRTYVNYPFGTRMHISPIPINDRNNSQQLASCVAQYL